MKNKQGSNQYYQRRSMWKIYLALYIYIVSGCIGWGLGHKFFPTPKFSIISPLPQKAYASTLPTPMPSEHEQIVAYIKDVFGIDAPKAFQLLSCENHALNPLAVNDNTKWGGVGQDIGVFQVNNTWQKVQNKYLYNWRINIQIAKQLFDENGGHFNLWTCGKRMGI